MGVDPYLIAPTLILAMAQRLVRRICPNSGREAPIAGSIQMLIDEQFKDLPDQYRSRITDAKSVLHLAPTPECPNGTRGRMAVMETLEITPELEKLILVNAPEADMYKVARENGFISMREDAIMKALRHEIPFEEVGDLGGGFLEAGDDADPDATPVDNSAPLPEREAV